VEKDNNIFDSDKPASNIVFIMDHSLSMRSQGKSTAARQELVRKLEAMTPDQKFYVMFFHSDGYDAMPTPGPVAATPENVRAMTNWLFSVGHRFGSDPSKAVERALDLAPAPDTLWLLSDGEFSNSKDVVDAIRAVNGPVGARVNTIDFYSHDGEEGMRRIAGENNGIYRFVPPPDKNAAAAPDGTTPPAGASDQNPPSSP